ncbi:conserved hypothetical protein [Candidatus Methylobacter favarea]|uniref:Uncharacterized protein n=1 Tax=Candidatus Methylobacter favarea TaxID=2707345 RepID=A0A8S0WQM9_9GAMM|nr:hypothetical protein [Candidatus Methylobacter favarea]CAA9891539.1 conserved hypothetical protein [Candidatus Methylobacter favarea]
MTDNIENRVPEQLHAIRADIVFVEEDAQEIKSPLIIIESGIATVRRDGGDFAVSIVDQLLLYERISRIEKPLELS